MYKPYTSTSTQIYAYYKKYKYMFVYGKGHV